MVQKDVKKISVHTEWGPFMREFDSRRYPDSKIIVLVLAETSSLAFVGWLLCRKVQAIEV